MKSISKIVNHFGLFITLKNSLFLFRNKGKHIKIGYHANIGKQSQFEGNNSVGDYSKFDGLLGFGSYIGENCSIVAKVGRFTCIGPNVKTVYGKHPMKKFVSIHPAFFSTRKQAGFTYVCKDIYEEKTSMSEIGNDVWVGANVTIVNDVAIGDGAIIAAGAVVVSDIPPYTVYGGVPAKLIRDRFDAQKKESLMKIEWWNWDAPLIQERSEDFSDIDSFVIKYEVKNDD